MLPEKLRQSVHDIPRRCLYQRHRSMNCRKFRSRLSVDLHRKHIVQDSDCMLHRNIQCAFYFTATYFYCFFWLEVDGCEPSGVFKFKEFAVLLVLPAPRNSKTEVKEEIDSITLYKPGS